MSSIYTFEQLDSAYVKAEEIMKDRAVSFYQAFKELPRQRFKAVAALYAFCRYADDAVDHAPEDDPQGMLNNLEQLESQVLGLYQKPFDSLKSERKLKPASEFVQDTNPWWPAFEDTVKSWQIPKDGLINQIQGQRQDAEFKGIETVADLVEYGRLVAGSVGIMMVPILVHEDSDWKRPDFLKACEDLGVAMQITNILRDVGEDLRTRDRLYLPLNLLKKYGVSLQELKVLVDKPKTINITADIPDGFVKLWEELAELADEYYSSYEDWLDFFHPTSRLPLVAAAKIYRGIADAVRASDYNCFTKRCYTNETTRAKLLVEAFEQVENY